MKKIRRKLVVLFAIGTLVFNSGCIYLVVGGIGAVGGYIVSPDTVEGITDHDIAAVWDTAIETISVMGLIDEKEESSGRILASIHGVHITITMITLSASATKLTVKARKAFLPRISLAQDIFVKIMSRVEESVSKNHFKAVNS